MTNNPLDQGAIANPQTPRTHLFANIFWQVLPAHYDGIESRWLKVARLYYEASSAIMTTDREAGRNSLKAELEMLEHEIGEYRSVIQGIDMQDVIGLYITAGRQKWRAEQIAREDFQDIETSLKELENKAKEIKADVVYGFGGAK